MTNDTQKSRVVTGAGSGIGRGRGAGARRVRATRSCSRGGARRRSTQTVRELPARTARDCWPCRPTSPIPRRCGRSSTARSDAFGRLDVLFNNAGVGAPGVPLDELTVEQWRTVVDTNLTGPFLCTQQAFRLMKSQTPKGGRIINNGSISATVPRPYSAPYTATKHAITGLTKSTSLDGRKHDIACGQIDIGNAATELAAKMAKGVPQANGEIAVEPLMDVNHVARAVVYMAGLPLDANVQFMTVMATKMPFIGRG